MSPPDVSVVIPAFDEEARLGPTVERLAAFLRAGPWRWEILVVDDGSRDGTAALAARLAAHLPELRLVDGGPNRGKGHAVRLGMRAARGRVRVMYDADGSTPVTELPRLLAAIESGAAVAIGSRYVGGAVPTSQPLWRRIWSRMVNLVVRRTIVPGVRDTHCGCKAFTAAAASDLFGRATVDGWAFDLEVLGLAHRLGHRVVEVPVAWQDDARSRVRPLRDLGRAIADMRAVQRSLARCPYALTSA
jgi:dolichyl-phosphate beta-glucosyltransferase